MKLAKSLIKTLLFTFAAVTFASCDEVSSDDRFIQLPPVQANRTVLLEEFTGQLCVNCPNAHKVIEDLTSQFSDNLIVVSIHAGGDAFSFGEGQVPGIVGLRIPEGEQYAANAGISSYPAGIVGRTSGVQTMDQWAASIRSQIALPTSADISLKATFDNQTNTINITSEVVPYENISGNLQLWVVEDNINAIQIQPNGKLEINYTHNHVFRACVNGVNGDKVALVTRQPQSFTHSIAKKDNWNVENLSIVAFIYTPSGVVQAAKAHVETDL